MLFHRKYSIISQFVVYVFSIAVIVFISVLVLGLSVKTVFIVAIFEQKLKLVKHYYCIVLNIMLYFISYLQFGSHSDLSE